jgi:hypothetical protein
MQTNTPPTQFGYTPLTPPTPSSTRSRRSMLVDVINRLRNARIGESGLNDGEIRDRLRAALVLAGLPAISDRIFKSGCCAPLWVDGVVVDIRKKRPERGAVLTLVHRYAATSDVTAIVLILERNVVVPDAIDHKPIHILSLNSLLAGDVR